MNIPIWIWYIAGGAVVLFTVLYIVGAIFGFLRFRKMDKDFNQQRERVRRGIRRT